MRAIRLAVALAIVVLSGCGGATFASLTPSRGQPRGSSVAGPCGLVRSPPMRYDHVIWVVLENKAISQIVGSPDARYVNDLASRCGSLSQFFAEAHPSLPNYLALTSGSTQGITDDLDPGAHKLRVANIFSQLGRGWRALEDSMSSNCALIDSGPYAVRHNPATYYADQAGTCRALDVPLGSVPDLSARFIFVTPNLCHDMHDCSVKVGDAWLATFLGGVFSSDTYRSGRTAVFVTWDESDRSSSNHIATLVVAPSIKPGTISASRFTHYSMLRTTEELLGLGFIGKAGSAASMRSALNL